MIDRVVNDLGRKLVEVPVGFKMVLLTALVRRQLWFPAGKRARGASFLRFAVRRGYLTR